MKQKTTVESRVLEILMECPASRYDDMILILHYYNRFGYIKAGNLPLEDIVLTTEPWDFLALRLSEEQGSECSHSSLRYQDIR